MALYWKGTAGLLLSAILGIAISGKAKDLGIVLYMVVCCMAAAIAVEYLAPVLELFRSLADTGGVSDSTIGILLKALGIGLISQIGGMICTDSGSAALGKSLHILSSTVILYLSVPLISDLLSIIRNILGEL